MCVLLYAASDAPLPVIAWNPSQPAFHVAALASDAVPVLQHFSKPYAYLIGSHSKCACGFNTGQFPSQAPEDVAGAEASLAHLADYLAAATRVSGAVELFACSAGDETAATARRLELTPRAVRESTLWSEPTAAIIRAAP